MWAIISKTSGLLYSIDEKRKIVFMVSAGSRKDAC